MTERKSWNEIANYFDEEKKCADWYNGVVNRILWDMFECQEDWIYMCNETEDRKPKIKSAEKFNKSFSDAFDDAVSWMRESIWYLLLGVYVRDDINLDEDTEWYLREYLDLDENDDLRARINEDFDIDEENN